MHDDDTALFNLCTDLVSRRKNEPFLRRLLESKRAGEWVRLADFCAQAGLPPASIKRDVFATWLPDPVADDGYAVVMFYDDESKWSMAAQYNRARLLGEACSDPTNGAVASAQSCSGTSRTE